MWEEEDPQEVGSGEVDLEKWLEGNYMYCVVLLSNTMM